MPVFKMRRFYRKILKILFFGLCMICVRWWTNFNLPFPCNIMSLRSCVKPHIHEHAEWFANRSWTVCEPNTRMCGRDYESALRHLWIGHIPFTKNQNLSVFWTNTKRTGCAGCLFHAPGVLCSPQVGGKLINRAPLMHHKRMAQHVSDTLVYTKLYTAERQSSTTEETHIFSAHTTKLLTALHGEIQNPGLPKERKEYLYKKMRPFVNKHTQNVLCPKPT